MLEALALFAFLMQEAWYDARMEAADWVGERHFEILEAAFPMDGYSRVQARSYEDLHWSESETWFCIDDHQNELVAEVRMPNGKSVVDHTSERIPVCCATHWIHPVRRITSVGSRNANTLWMLHFPSRW
jgi:hypothetical protein